MKAAFLCSKFQREKIFVLNHHGTFLIYNTATKRVFNGIYSHTPRLNYLWLGSIRLIFLASTFSGIRMKQTI